MSIPNPKTAGAAVRTFPVLLKWGLCTRSGVHAYPIGGSKAAREAAAGRATTTTAAAAAAAPAGAALSDEEKRACVRANAPTLYHDLGVVAFDGCSYQQAKRVGDILARTVAAAARTSAAGSGVTVPEERALEAYEVFPALWKLEEETWGHRVGDEDV
ncbi:hypothetical protein V2A60_000725 [Cordyceps javanica]|uniref:HAD family hydrolase n=1 Tax=Cordyceps javanica TaxID=43265 RepID=A0A545VZX0_9HYPO|nr:HAD family hydrolase [Cordyceps javanica]TQW07266.1 HAD family hydrolase [Cordyceps javanica]